MVAAILALAVVAHAEISSIQPATGEGEPGQTVSALVTVSTAELTSCLTATSEIPLVITFDGLTTTCGTGTWFATMEVTIPALTAPGTYAVSVREVTLEGSLLGSTLWPLVVTAQDTTTTTLVPDLTLLSSTTTTSASSTTTTSTTATTTTTASTGAPSTEPSPTTSAVAPTTTGGEATAGSSASTAHPPADNPTTIADPAAPIAAGEQSRIAEEAPFSEIAVSSGLIEVADRALPPVFAKAVLSPFVIIEVLLRALARTTGSLLIPLGVTILAGFGLARRLRRDAEELPELDDFVEIPDDEEGDLW
ncbi:MAG: hypothetical protein KY394_06850 [Actinobacteria bacterium]|nr:hypothetical protein [Actinomycetota bacterium]